MENNCSKSYLPALILAIGLAIGLLGAGYMVKQSRVADRFVEVKGFSEQIVKSDYASWQLNYRANANDLETALKNIEDSQGKVVKFLEANGFEKSEMEMGQVKITDRQANPYGDNREFTTARFIVDSSVAVRSKKVDNILTASQKTLDIAKQGVVIAGDYMVPPNFEFKGLNDLKPKMIEEATKDARRAASQFAKDAGASVGSISGDMNTESSTRAHQSRRRAISASERSNSTRRFLRASLFFFEPIAPT